MSTTPPRNRRLRRRARRATATGVPLTGVVLAAVTLVATACSPSHRSAAASTTSSIPDTTTTTQPPPQYQPSPYSWDRATSPVLALGGGASATLSALLAPELTGSWQLFGSRLGANGSPSATVWSSPDALAWTAAPLGPGPGQATAAAHYKTATVAVGSTGQGAGQQAAVWLAAEGAGPFTAQSVPSSIGPSVMTQVAAGALGMFASGTVDGRFAMWSSTNGRRWSELTGAEKVIAGTPGARVDALLAVGDFVYAAGSLQSGTAPQAALWSTGDGINWHLVGSAATSFSGAGGRVIYSLAPLGTGLVAVGAIDQGSGWTPASWISPDGQSWSLPSVDFPGVPATGPGAAYTGPSGGSAARSVSAVPTLAGSTSLVAVGGGPSAQVAWQSNDGLHWSSLSLPAVDAAASSWRAEVAAGTVDTTVVLDAQPGQPYMLTRHSALGGPGSTTATGRPGAATSATGGAWSQPSADPSVFGPVRPQAVPVSLQLSGGRLQLTLDLVHRPQTIGPATVSTLVLSSSNGSTWTVSTPAAALPGSAAPGPAGGPPTLPATGARAARLPGRWVAVTLGAGATAGSSTQAAPQVWTSPNGVSWKKTAVLSLPSASGPSATTPTRLAGASATPGQGALSVNGVCTARLTDSAGAAVTATTAAPAHRYVVVAVGSAATTSTALGGASGDGTVGSEGTIRPATVTTRAATAWSSTTGTSWRSAPVGGAPPTGSTSSMSGCLSTPSGLFAYGIATTATGVPIPALWRSTDGTAWTRVAIAAFGAGAPAPLVSLTIEGESWLSVANPDPAADPFSPAAAGGRAGAGPAATAGTDAGVGASPSLEDGRNGLWLSADGGSTWQIIDTATAPWLGAQQSVIDLVGFAPGGAVHAASPSQSTTSSSSRLGGATTSTAGGGGVASSAAARSGRARAAAGSVPVVVGVVDGQLAVWTGTAAPAG